MCVPFVHFTRNTPKTYSYWPIGDLSYVGIQKIGALKSTTHLLLQAPNDRDD